MMTPKSIERDQDADLIGDQDYNLWILLQNTRDAMTAVRAAELANCGLSNVEAAVLLVVQLIERGGATQATPAEISRWLLRKPHSITGLMDRMQKRGMVQRVNDLSKKNRVRIALTAKGLEAYRASVKRDQIEGVLRALPEEDRERLRKYLQVLCDAARKNLDAKHPRPFPHLK